MRAVQWSAIALVLAACGGGSGGAGSREQARPDGEQKPVKLEEIRGTVALIEVVGVTGERAEQARAVLKSAVGTPFDRDQVAGDLRSIWALGGVADVTADARLTAGGVAVRYRVQSQPRIRSIDIQGSHEIPTEQWMSRLPVKAGELLDPARLVEVRRGMVGLLLERGHQAVKVSWTTKPSGDKGGTVDVVISIEEGPAVSISQIAFSGNKAVAQKKLAEMLARGGQVAGARYYRAAMENALVEVNSQYYDLGYVNVAIGPVEETLSAQRSSVQLVIPIVEGDQFRVGKLATSGQLHGTEREYLDKLGVKPGQIFSRRKIAEGLERIRAFHQAKGAAAGVEPLTEIDAKKKRINLTLRVGPAGG